MDSIGEGNWLGWGIAVTVWYECAGVWWLCKYRTGSSDRRIFCNDVQPFENTWRWFWLTAGHDSRMMPIEIESILKTSRFILSGKVKRSLNLPSLKKLQTRPDWSCVLSKENMNLINRRNSLDTLKKIALFLRWAYPHALLPDGRLSYNRTPHCHPYGDKKLGIKRHRWRTVPQWMAHGSFLRGALISLLRYGLVYQLSGQCFTSREEEEKFLAIYHRNSPSGNWDWNDGTKRPSKLDIQNITMKYT